MLRQEGFPVEMLPPVVAAGTDVGVLSMSWFDIPKGDLPPRIICNVILRFNCHQSMNARKFITLFFSTDTPVSVALGDVQCSVMSTIIDTSTDVVLNISTSAQMCFVMPPGNLIL